MKITPEFLRTPQIQVPSPLVGEGQGEGATTAHRRDKSKFVIILEGVGLVNVFLRHGKGDGTLNDC
jgi:hypothetical protein